VQTGPRQKSATQHPKPNTYTSTSPNKVAQLEINNHADTTCFGSNLTAIHFTGKTCKVRPFSDQYSTMVAWDNPETGETTISIFHQGLWFGNGMTNSLINPNQCRMNGIELCDNPFNTNQRLANQDHLTDIEIPTEFANSFVFFKTRAQSLDEIQTCPSMAMTDEAPWNPLKARHAPLLWEEEERQALVTITKMMKMNMAK
jgi:hypothetical protein